jgi:glutathione S-transferase
VSTLILYGVAFSTYVRTARMACVEKGAGYTLAHDSVDEVRSRAHLALHPFGKMPVMRQRRSFRETEPPPPPGA